MKLEGKIAIISGTGPNIGIEIAKILASEGASVVCSDYNLNNAKDAAEAINAMGGSALAVQTDIREETQVQNLVSAAIYQYGKIDILVNNAAIANKKSILNIEAQEWFNVLGVNLTGTFFCSKYVAMSMVEKGIKGSIINIASTSGHRGRANAIAYCSSKGGVLNMTRAMAIDLAPHQIRVNSVSPTQTGTPVSVISQPKPNERKAPEIPLGRAGEPREQAAAVLFLASEDSSFVTGIDLRGDGGALATWGISLTNPGVVATI